MKIYKNGRWDRNQESGRKISWGFQNHNFEAEILTLVTGRKMGYNQNKRKKDKNR